MLFKDFLNSIASLGLSMLCVSHAFLLCTHVTFSDAVYVHVWVLVSFFAKVDNFLSKLISTKLLAEQGEGWVDDHSPFCTRVMFVKLNLIVHVN